MEGWRSAHAAMTPDGAVQPNGPEVLSTGASALRSDRLLSGRGGTAAARPPSGCGAHVTGREGSTEDLRLSPIADLREHRGNLGGGGLQARCRVAASELARSKDATLTTDEWPDKPTEVVQQRTRGGCGQERQAAESLAGFRGLTARPAVRAFRGERPKPWFPRKGRRWSSTRRSRCCNDARSVLFEALGRLGATCHSAGGRPPPKLDLGDDRGSGTGVLARAWELAMPGGSAGFSRARTPVPPRLATWGRKFARGAKISWLCAVSRGWRGTR